MAHTFDTSLRTTASTNPLVQSYTAGSGATLMVLGIVTPGATARAGGVPSFNGDPFTQVDSTRIATETNVELWYLVNPVTSQAYDLVVPNVNADALKIITSTYKAQSGKTSALDVSTGNTGTTANPSLNVTTTVDGDVLVDILGDGLNTAPTAHSDTLISSTDDGLFSDSAQYALQATLGSKTLSWTVGADDWAYVLGAFKEVTPATAVVSTLKQVDTDHSTEVAVGGDMGGDGVSTNIYLDARIASQYFSDKLTLNVENRVVGTAFSDASTNTQAVSLWVNPKPPHVRRSHSTIYDSTLKRLIMFGGYDGTINYNDVWELTLDSKASPQPQWRQLFPTGTAPTARRTHIAWYDAGNNRMITGFGWTTTDNNNLYSLSFSGSRDGAWTTLSPTGTIPLARSQASVCNDVANNKAYLVCGWGAARYNNIVEIAYSSTNPAYTEKSADGNAAACSKRNDPAVVWDATNSRMIIFGGFDGTNRKADTWSYIPSSNTWADKTAVFSGTAPSTRELMFCALDTTNNRMVIFGGRNGTAATDVRTDMAYLTLTAGSETWNVVTPTAGEKPAFTWSNTGCYDPNHKVMLCVGGEDTSLQRTRHILGVDCSSSSTLSVVQAVLNQRFQGRDALAYAYNPDRNELLVAGGFARVDPTDSTFVNGDHTNDLWVYDFANNEWYNPIRDAFSGFTNREGATIIYDTSRARFIIFGGLTGNNTTNNTWYNDVWELKANADGKYILTKLAPTGTKPGNRWLHAAVYDINNNRMIVFGGDEAETYKNDLWELDFATSADGVWALLSPTGTAPSARRQPTYIYNASAGCMVISHGATSSTAFVSDTFKLDLSTNDGAWSAITISGTAPTARRGMSGAWMSSKKYMVCFGGFTGGTAHSNETFYLDMTDETAPITWTWNTLTPSTKPEARRSHATGLSATSNKMLIIAGRDNEAYTFNTRFDTWTLDISNATPTNWTWTNQNPNVYLNGSTAVTGLTSATNYHWQAWTTATLSGASAKSSFGGNAESATDFSTSTGGGSPAPSVFDSVTISEFVRIDPSIPLKFESVTVSEGVQISLSLPSPIVDSVTVSEFVKLDPSIPLLAESVTVSEFVKLDPSIPLLFESVTITDIPTVFIVSLVPSVFDSVTVTEFVKLDPSIPLISDSVTVSEFVRIDPSIPLISDSVAVSEFVRIDPSIPLLSESIAVSEFIRIDPSIPLLSDSVTVTDVPTILIVSLVPSVFDSVSITEDVRINPSLPVISDSVVVSEDVRIDPSIPVISESVSVSEFVKLDPSIPLLSESVTVSEFVKLDLSLPVISDSVVVSEDIRINPSIPLISDSITVSDVPTLVQGLVPSVDDSVTVSEFVKLDPSIPLLFESITVSEFIKLDPSLPVISDSVTVSEFAKLDPSIPVISDSVSVSEDVLLNPSIPVISESVTVSEFVRIDPSLPLLAESITVSDIPIVVIVSLVPSVFDAVVVSEDIRVDPSIPLLSEAISVTDVPRIDPSIPLISDSVTVVDVPTLSMVDSGLALSVFESAAVSEFVRIDPSIPLLSDTITISEFAKLDPSLPVISENITVSESIKIEPSLPLLSESITVTDVFSSNLLSYISVYDTVILEDAEVSPMVEDITVSEFVKLDLSIPLLFESITVTDVPSVTIADIGLSLSVFDAITVVDVPRIDPSIPLISDSVTVTDVPIILIVSLVPSVFDSIVIVEVPKLEEISFPFVFDSISVADVPTLEGVSLPSVFDVVAVSEFVRVDLSLPLISDSVSTTEFVRIDPSVPLIFESITVVDVPSIALSGFTPSVFDTVAVVEDVRLEPSIPLTAENITVVDIPTILIVTLVPSVFDPVSVSEDIRINPSLPIISDSVTISEFVKLDPSLPLLTESVMVSESVKLDPSIPVISDSVSVADVPSLNVFILLSVFDAVTVVDSSEIFVPTLVPSVFDAVTVDELFTTTGQILISLFDSVSVSDVPNIFIVTLLISVFDSVTATDVPSNSVALPVNVFDIVTVSEVELMNIPLPVNVFDSVSAIDVPLMVIVSLLPSVFDSVVVSENVKLDPSLPLLVDSINVSDVPTIFIVTLVPSVFDTVTASDVVTIYITTLFFSVFDSISVTENVRLGPSIPLLSETVTVADSPTISVMDNELIFDSVTVTDVPLVTVTISISVFDSTTVSDIQNITIPSVFSVVFDNITATDVFSGSVVSNQDTISVFDSVTVSEGLVLGPSLPIVSEMISVVDQPVLVIQTLFFSVSEQITVSEILGISVPTAFVSVFDAIIVSEVVRIDPSLPVISDSVTVTDVLVIMIQTLFVSVTENVVVTESLGVLVPTLVPSVSQTILVSDGVFVLIPTYFISVFDTILISEGQSIVTICEVKVNEVVSISESTEFDRMTWGADSALRHPSGYVKIDMRPEGYVLAESFMGEIRGG